MNTQWKIIKSIFSKRVKTWQNLFKLDYLDDVMMTPLMTSQNHVPFHQVLENSTNNKKKNKAISKTALKHAVKKMESF